MWYRNNIEEVENYDLLNHEILSTLSQYIPGINADVTVSSAVLVRMLQDFIEELHEKTKKVNLEIDNLKEQIGGQYPREDSSMSSPRRSRGSSGNQRPNLNETYNITPGGSRSLSRRSHLSQEEYASPSRAQPERPVQELNRRWGPNDFMQHQLPPVQDFNRRWNLADQFARMQAENEPPNNSFRGSDQSHRQSPRQHSRSHSSQDDRQSPRAQQGIPFQADLNRRWGPSDFNQQQGRGTGTNRGDTMAEQFAMWRTGAEPQNPSFGRSDQSRNLPHQQEYDSSSEGEMGWDEGSY